MSKRSYIISKYCSKSQGSLSKSLNSTTSTTTINKQLNSSCHLFWSYLITFPTHSIALVYTPEKCFLSISSIFDRLPVCCKLFYNLLNEKLYFYHKTMNILYFHTVWKISPFLLHLCCTTNCTKRSWQYSVNCLNLTSQSHLSLKFFILLFSVLCVKLFMN